MIYIYSIGTVLNDIVCSLACHEIYIWCMAMLKLTGASSWCVFLEMRNDLRCWGWITARSMCRENRQIGQCFKIGLQNSMVHAVHASRWTQFSDSPKYHSKLVGYILSNITKQLPFIVRCYLWSTPTLLILLMFVIYPIYIGLKCH